MVDIGKYATTHKPTNGKMKRQHLPQNDVVWVILESLTLCNPVAIIAEMEAILTENSCFKTINL